MIHTGSYVQSTLAPYWVGKVVGLMVEAPAFPYRVRWDNGSIEACAASELLVLDGVSA
jgi:hypothetical protein